MYSLQNMWAYGEVGNRLCGIRDSTIYGSSAKSITNMLVTDIGSLKIARKYNKKIMFNNSDVINSVSTSKGFYIVLTKTELVCIDYETNSVITKQAHGMKSNVDISVVGSDRIGLSDNVNKIKLFDIKDKPTCISLDTETLKKMNFPVKEKKIVQLDLWKITAHPTEAGKFRIIQMSNFTNPLIKTAGGSIFLYNSKIKISRIYSSYNAVVDIEYFTGPSDGMIIGIMRTFEETKNGNTYIVDNTKVSIGALTDDPKYKGSYFTSVTGDGEGVMTFGKLVDEVQYANKLSFYQDRMIINKNGFFYVSKINQISDFRNGVEVDEAFFFQLNPISGKSGELLGMESFTGLFIITTAGVYILGGGNFQITSQNFGSAIVVASDETVTNEYTVKDNSLFFINKKGVLKVVLMDRSSQQLAYNTYTVDRYSTKNLFNSISKLEIDDATYVCAADKTGNFIYLIDFVGNEFIFRKTKLELKIEKNKIICIDDIIIGGDSLYIPTEINYPNAEIILNNFFLSGNPNSQSYNAMYSLDKLSRCRNTRVKIMNENANSVRGVKINEKKLDNYKVVEENLYLLRTDTNLEDGIKIEILTNENNGIIELQGVQSEIDVTLEK